MHESILDLARELPFPEDPYADWAEPARTEVQIAAVNARLEHRRGRPGPGPGPVAAPGPGGDRAQPVPGAGVPGRDGRGRGHGPAGRRAAHLRTLPPGARRGAGRGALGPTCCACTGRSWPSGTPAGRRRRPERSPAQPAAHEQPGRRSASSAGLTQLRRAGRAGPAHRSCTSSGRQGAGKSAFLAELGRHALGRVGIGHAGSSTGVLRLAWLRAALVAARRGAGGARRGRRRRRPTCRCRSDELELVGNALAGPEPVFLAVDDAADLDAVQRRRAGLARPALPRPAHRADLLLSVARSPDGRWPAWARRWCCGWSR